MAAKDARAKKAGRKAPRCRTCGKVIRVPAGWSAGSAARKHYWAKHPEVMRSERDR